MSGLKARFDQLPDGFGAAGEAADLGLYAGLLPLYSKLADTVQSGATRRRYEQAYPAMTGRNLTPIDMGAWQDALRRLGISAAITR